jgi:hypothetical protein
VSAAPHVASELFHLDVTASTSQFERDLLRDAPFVKNDQNAVRVCRS